MNIFKQIFSLFQHTRRKSERFRATIDVFFEEKRKVEGRIENISFGGAKVRLLLSDLDFFSALEIGSTVNMYLVLPKALESVILFNSPILVSVQIIRKNDQEPVFGAAWKEINPVVLSHLISYISK